MKKLLVMLLSLMMATSLVACGGNETDGESGTSKEGTENKTEQSDFEEIVAVDNEACMIKITGIEEDEFWGYTVKTALENKSADKTYMFSVQSAAVNGVETDPLFATEVAAGKKANDDILFMDTILEESGIEKFTDIEITFRVYDSEDWSADAVALETVHIYPYGEDNAETFTREDKESDTVLVDNESVKVIVTGYTEDEIWGYTVNLFLINKTDKTVMFAVDETSVNGYMIDPFYATEVSAGKCEFSSMSFSDMDFEENGITEVSNIDFTLRVYDSNDWTADDIVNQKVTLTP